MIPTISIPLSVTLAEGHKVSTKKKPVGFIFSIILDM